ncbi:sensor histidine kinase [Massilia sp. TS11]|uniref:sensor histidine kinase n=1 Tax=Massilia sp. TS11 TaxID=2908003 RepID=UPI001EDA8B14|nr:histidine kinase [Massilia sp. TS11]MCG2584998.1 histidine kinase [Massilia sp. TS11]
MWKPRHPFGLAGLVPCLAFIAITAGAQWVAHATYAGLGNLPLAASAQALANLMSAPPSASYAGSARMALNTALYNGGAALAYALFAWAFWTASDPARPATPARLRFWLGVQSALALFAAADLLYFTLLAVGYLLPWRAARRWLLLIVLATPATQLLILALGVGQAPPDFPWLIKIGLTALLQSVAVGVGHLMARERSARLRLQQAHGELLATQRLLADMVRSSERGRIARNLHDAIGHHLTALHLHLDLAARQSAPVPPALDVARGLARDLLAEVRAVISAERARLGLDLEPALRALCAAVPAPPVSLDFDAPPLDAPLIADCAFHLVQEGLTNALRHAAASQIRVRVQASAGALEIEVTDDGRGGAAAEGNGLRGLRERVAAVGGSLHCTARPGAGFSLHARIPLEWQT